MSDRSLRRTLRSERVPLRGPLPRDEADRLAAGNHPDFIRMIGIGEDARHYLTGDEAQRWYERIEDNPLHWMIEVDDHCVGATGLHDVDERNRNARYTSAIFNVIV